MISKSLTRASIHIAMDGFGRDYCGLSYLNQLAVNYLKADKRFTTAIGTDAMKTNVLT
jgi:EAL domain-containing protein (putative c-di-GMP-specific phosphodiesterase class I)